MFSWYINARWQAKKQLGIRFVKIWIKCSVITFYIPFSYSVIALQIFNNSSHLLRSKITEFNIKENNFSKWFEVFEGNFVLTILNRKFNGYVKPLSINFSLYTYIYFFKEVMFFYLKRKFILKNSVKFSFFEYNTKYIEFLAHHQ